MFISYRVFPQIVWFINHSKPCSYWHCPNLVWEKMMDILNLKFLKLDKNWDQNALKWCLENKGNFFKGKFQVLSHCPYLAQARDIWLSLPLIACPKSQF